MRHASDKGVSGRQAVIAVEEPESHLHPKAIHELREVLNEMSDSHQIVLTTHNPLFVDRLNIPSNIIVSDNKARPARSLEEIREVLGVRASDNLKSAALVLVVEGEDDRVALHALLRNQATKIRAALGSGMLAIDSLQGGSNLAYKLGLLRDSLCTAYCFCDDDTAGRDAVQKAREQGLLTMADFTLAHCDGRAESEIEDLYDPAVYEAMIKSNFGVSLTSPRFKNSKKWSTRVRDTFEQQGKPWNNALEAEVKDKVARAVAANPSAALVPATRTAFDALVASLIERLDRIQPGKGEHMTRKQKTASAEEATLTLAGVR
jgi:predicted ATP-dependent endonuclease of OLD family